MAQTKDGAILAAARRLGITEAKYRTFVATQKWCTSCKGWHARAAFGRDRSRYDGLASNCLASRVVAVGRPGMRERRQASNRGEKWCRGCRDWRPAQEVRAGVCRTHLNAEARAYYHLSPEFREKKLARNSGAPSWWRADEVEDFDGFCAYGCGRPATDLDHILPRARRGQTAPGNLVPACSPCNSEKRAGDPLPWIGKGLQAFPDQWERKLALAEAQGTDTEVV